MSNLEPHPSLPARPPPSSYSGPPRQHNNQSQRGPYPSAPVPFAGFTPRSVVSRAPAMQPSAPLAHAPMTASQAPFYAGGYQPNPHPSSTAYYPPQQHSGFSTPAPHLMANAYAMPGAASRGFGGMGAYDPEQEARIAEWNSAYTPKDDAGSKKGGQNSNANTTALGIRSGDIAATPAADGGKGGEGANKGKPKTVVRQGGGKTWEDPSLLEWNPLHPRLFVGNLAGEVTDDSLLKAFSKYPTVSKARVIRDKKSTKSKSYGFVSFSGTEDYFAAAREMDGRYIGSHPVRIKRANTEITPTTKREDKHAKHKNNNKHATGTGAVISGAPTYNNNGVQKFSHKSKSGGPRILG